MFNNKKKNHLVCPYCGHQISKSNFNCKQALRRINRAAIKMHKESESLKAAAITPEQAYAAFKTLDTERPFGWFFCQNEVSAELKPLFEEVSTIINAFGIKAPENAHLPADRDIKTHVVDDFWFWCLDYVYRKIKKKNAPKLLLAYDDKREQYNFLFQDSALSGDEYVLASNVSPVCPNPKCKTVLWNSALEVTDDPIRIVLLGDPSTGKTVWQVALTAFLEKRKNSGNEASYQISEHAKLILPETLSWRLNERKNVFLGGTVPRQTTPEKNGAYSVGNAYSGMTSEYEDRFGGSETADRQDEGRADALVLILKEETEHGRLKSCRFVRITDVAGEDALGHRAGFYDSAFLRSMDALFLFAYICGKNEPKGNTQQNPNGKTTDGLKTVREFMADTQNKALPYFAVMFPKVDEAYFQMRLHKTLVKTFNTIFMRVLQFNLECSADAVEKFKPLVKLFSEQYLHYSPEVIAGHLSSDYRDKLNAAFSMNTPEEFRALFDEIVSDPDFGKTFTARNESEWFAELCNRHLFFAERPCSYKARPDEELHRLQSSFYLRNLLNGEVDFDRARIVSDDIGFYAISSLGRNSNIDAENMSFDIDNWEPVNLFDPLVRFLRRYVS